MKRCIIIPAWAPGPINELVKITEDDYIVCADAGYVVARREGIRPHAVVGDFDSLPHSAAPSGAGTQVVSVSAEKDETDTFLCMEKGIEAGCKAFVLLEGLGGRLDHTLAHLQLMAWAVKRGYPFEILSRSNRVTMMLPGSLSVEKREGYKLSLLAYGGDAEGVTLHNVKYPLTDATLTCDFPLGISNEFLEGDAGITFTKGMLMVILSQDEG